MSPDRHDIEDTLLTFVTSGVRCTIIVREDAAERRIHAVVTSATSESVVLHEAGTACIHVYQTACVVAVMEDPSATHRVPEGRHRHPARSREEMLVHL
jgi:hypothetical protein